jgi:Domain of unknown function (DUF4397)
MKNVQQNLKRWPGLLGMMCLLALMLSACTKTVNNTPQQPVAVLGVIDASPDAPALAFFLNINQVNALPLSNGNYINYFNTYAGKIQATFFQSGTSTIIARDTINLVANKAYTLFLANTIAKPDLILLSDSVTRPASSTASIRLVNVSPDAGAVDLVIKGGATLASNINYKGASVFAPIAVVSSTDTLQIRQAGTSTVLSTVPAAKFQIGAVYTVWLYGLANTSVDNEKLTSNIMVNAYFY